MQHFTFKLLIFLISLLCLVSHSTFTRYTLSSSMIVNFVPKRGCIETREADNDNKKVEGHRNKRMRRRSKEQRSGRPQIVSCNHRRMGYCAKMQGWCVSLHQEMSLSLSIVPPPWKKNSCVNKTKDPQ